MSVQNSIFHSFCDRYPTQPLEYTKIIHRHFDEPILKRIFLFYSFLINYGYQK